MIREIVQAILLALKAFFVFERKLQDNAAQKEVADAVEDTANRHRDAMRSADGGNVRPDDPGLFRD